MTSLSSYTDKHGVKVTMTGFSEAPLRGLMTFFVEHDGKKYHVIRDGEHRTTVRLWIKARARINGFQLAQAGHWRAVDALPPVLGRAYRQVLNFVGAL